MSKPRTGKKRSLLLISHPIPVGVSKWFSASGWRQRVASRNGNATPASCQTQCRCSLFFEHRWMRVDTSALSRCRLRDARGVGGMC